MMLPCVCAAPVSTATCCAASCSPAAKRTAATDVHRITAPTLRVGDRVRQPEEERSLLPASSLHCTMAALRREIGDGLRRRVVALRATCARRSRRVDQTAVPRFSGSYRGSILISIEQLSTRRTRARMHYAGRANEQRPTRFKPVVNQLVNSFCTILLHTCCLLYTSPSPRDQRGSRMPSSA